ncbi:MAG: NYN domain-containing protein [Opitutaceae bacterium]
MNAPAPNLTLAIFLDLENIARGASDAHFPPFDIRKVLERLLLKGNVVVKKAYCDFDRFKDLKLNLHEAAFELIEIPHARQAGKNSADIRMVVDALDLCYTNEHVDAFAIISGDSDFSPLVSKLRENAKVVIGLGVKNSTSDLFISNCDEFIYYDDLVRAVPQKITSRDAPASKPRPAEESKGPDPAKAMRLLVTTVSALIEERGADEPIWASMTKQAIKRQSPGFNERAYGFSSFTDLLREAEKRGFVRLEEKSGNWQVRLVE